MIKSQESEVAQLGKWSSVTTKRKKRLKWGRLLFLIPALVYMLVIFIYPLIYNLTMSFEDYTTTSFITGVAPFIGFKNYAAVLSDVLMKKTVWNTILFTVGSIVFQFSIGMIFALFFKRKFPLSQTIRTLLLIPWLLPLIVSGTTFKWIFDATNGIFNQVLLDLHLIQHPVGWLITPNLALAAVIITNIWVGIPFNMVLLYGGLQDIPNELYEAGALDGANRWQSFWHITIPSLRPVISIVLMLGLIYTLKVFDVIMVLTGGGPANSTQILSTWSYTLSFTNLAFGQGAAVGNIMIIISLAFTAVYLRMSRDQNK
jgi:multiple sugar transport system permease protein